MLLSWWERISGKFPSVQSRGKICVHVSSLFCMPLYKKISSYLSVCYLIEWYYSVVLSSSRVSSCRSAETTTRSRSSYCQMEPSRRPSSSSCIWLLLPFAALSSKEKARIATRLIHVQENSFVPGIWVSHLCLFLELEASCCCCWWEGWEACFILSLLSRNNSNPFIVYLFVSTWTILFYYSFTFECIYSLYIGIAWF